jgi:hypothetical protein
VLPADLMLDAGEIGDRAIDELGARKGILAASGLILGGGGLIGLDVGASDAPNVGALTLVTGNAGCVV